MRLRNRQAFLTTRWQGERASCIYPKHGAQRCCSFASYAGLVTKNWEPCSAVETMPLSSILYGRASGTTGSLSTRCHHSGKIYYAEKRRHNYADIHPWNRRRKYVLQESEVHKVIKIRCRVFNDEPKRHWTIIRVHLSGAIHILVSDRWIDVWDTDVSPRMQAQIRFITWGSTREVQSYRLLEYVPRMRLGDRFRIFGDPENNGWYEFVDYMHSAGGVRLRRILPDYWYVEFDRLNRISNTPWTPENHPCEGCYGTHEETARSTQPATDTNQGLPAYERTAAGPAPTPERESSE